MTEPRSDGPPDGPPTEPPTAPPTGSSTSNPPPVGDAGAPFDPYRFGPPAHPIDPAYAPPGYVPPPPPVNPTPGPGGYPAAPSPYGQPQYGQPPQYGQTPQAPQYGQPPSAYGQPPTYGQPPAYGYGYVPPTNPYGASPYGAPKAGNGIAVTALVLGIVAALFFWVPFGDGLVIIPGVIFGAIGISVANKRGGAGRVMAIIGLCLSLLAAAGCIAISVYIVKNCSLVDDGFGNGNKTLHCNEQVEN